MALEIVEREQVAEPVGRDRVAALEAVTRACGPAMPGASASARPTVAESRAVAPGPEAGWSNVAIRSSLDSAAVRMTRRRTVSESAFR